jgi:hypothetical protein
MKIVGMLKQRFLETKVISIDQRYVLILIFMEGEEEVMQTNFHTN